MNSYQKIARILRIDKGVIRLIDEKLSALTGKKSVIDKIVEENETIIRNRLDFLGLSGYLSAEKVNAALMNKIETDERRLSEKLGEKILERAKKIAGEPRGFFLKEEKAIELLKSEPPRKIIKYLGYKNIDELFQKENMFEVFSALRFLEDKNWLNNVFFKQYEKLKPGDFEERPLITISLGSQWVSAAQAFVGKKYHNISHLKELGVIFIIPVSLDFSGELTRTTALIFHYFNEVPFYSDIFKILSKNEESFAKNIISLLRGDVLGEKPPNPSNGKTQWLIVQRYLAKENENDWRLFEPHINPEALHWARAERLLAKSGLVFWDNLGWVGDYFPTETGTETPVSFNIIDVTMKRNYHHQEALWNKIFSEYFGEEKMEDLIKKNIIKGWFEI